MTKLSEQKLFLYNFSRKNLKSSRSPHLWPFCTNIERFDLLVLEADKLVFKLI